MYLQYFPQYVCQYVKNYFEQQKEEAHDCLLRQNIYISFWQNPYCGPEFFLFCQLFISLHF